MVKIGDAIDLIASHRIGISLPNLTDKNLAYAKRVSNMLKPRFLICSQTDEIRCYKPPIIRSALNYCHETCLARAEPSEEMAEIIRYFQIEAQPLLHDDPSKIEPSNPLLALPCQRADGQRIDGLASQMKNRPPSGNYQDSTKLERCQPGRFE